MTAPAPEPEPLNVQVGRRIYHVEVLHPAWCGWDVICFYNTGWPHMIYSWDDHACNAVMYANGVDHSDGAAKPLPFYSQDMEACWEVIREIHDRGASLTMEIPAEGSASAVIEDRRPVVFTASGDGIAEAVCKAFVLAYPPIDPMP